MLPGSRLLDGPPHHITPEEVIHTAQDYEFVVLFTSTVGFHSDLRMARAMKDKKPDMKIAFVGPARADQACGKPAGERGS